MSYESSLETLTISDLNKLDKLTGDELLLIQSQNGGETQQISVSEMISLMVDYLRGTEVSIIETDPTVPDFVKAITREDIDKWNSITELEMEVEKIKIPHVKISSLICEPNSVELGDVLESVTIKWDTNNIPITNIRLNDTNITDLLSNEYTVTGYFDKSTPFNLYITDDGGYVDSKEITLPFMNGIYYTAAEGRSITNVFIKNMENTLSDTNKIGFTVLPRSQYIYVAYPARFGSASFIIESEYVDFEFVETFSFTNAKNYTEDYYVYRSVNLFLGQTTVYIV